VINEVPNYADFGVAPLARIKGISEFLSEYEPIKYTIDGLLPGGSIYGLTAKRGAGKTAFLTATALAVSTGREDFLGFEVEKGRVAYIILENPTDFRMKLSVTAFARNVDVPSLNDAIRIIDMRLPQGQIMELLKRDADRLGPFQVVAYDTFQAGFARADFNDNNDTLKHAQSLREFTKLPGNPSVLVACHPVKNATKDNLEPYGGGSTMNELDGNLTAWNESGLIELGFNKVRGPEFEPVYFRIEKIGSPEILDNKGRQPQLPVLFRMTSQAVDERQDDSEMQRTNEDITLIIKAMRDNAGATFAQLEVATGFKRGKLQRQLERLALPKGGKLVANPLGKWTITQAGLKALTDGASN
jgi:AAA domain